MLAKKIDGTTWIIRLMKGEELITEIRQFCRENDIFLGWFTGLGAVKEVELATYLHEQKKYESTTLTGSLEIISLHGNITSVDEAPYLHIHMGISTEDNRMLGGHLNKAVIHPTCEIILYAYEGKVTRKKDPDTGLNHLDLSTE